MGNFGNEGSDEDSVVLNRCVGNCFDSIMAEAPGVKTLGVFVSMSRENERHEEEILTDHLVSSESESSDDLVVNGLTSLSSMMVGFASKVCDDSPFVTDENDKVVQERKSQYLKGRTILTLASAALASVFLKNVDISEDNFFEEFKKQVSFVSDMGAELEFVTGQGGQG